MYKIINNIQTSWKEKIVHESQKDYFKKLDNFVKSEYSSKKINPDFTNIFKCFEFFDFEKTKVVFLGQDPYHVEQMADGLSFSTKLKIKPKSLMNIFKELKDDLKIDRNNCDLTDIAKQGVLLLNTTLTVEVNKPLSHINQGWEVFTDEIIKTISKNLNNVIFVLMGNKAIEKKMIIDNKKHFIIQTSHPSPFSYHKSFKGSKIFSKINELLLSNNKETLIW